VYSTKTLINKKSFLGVYQKEGKRFILKKKSSNKDDNPSQKNILEMKQALHELTGVYEFEQTLYIHATKQSALAWKTVNEIRAENILVNRSGNELVRLIGLI